MNFFRTSSAETAVFQKSDLHLNEPYFSFAEFSGLTLENLNAVSEIREMLNSKIESVTDLHYEYILNSKALKKIIEDHSTLEKLKKTFREYLKSLFSGKIDDDYCRKRQIIGTVHYNIKLYPEWYIGAQGRILDVLIPMLTERIRDRKKLSFALVSLNKLIHFDSQIILKSYSEMFTYSMNETLCSAVERTSDSKNIEAAVNTKEKIQNTVDTLEKIKSNMDLSRNDWKKSEKEFTYLLQESDRSLLEMKNTRDRISESLSSIEKISSSYRELVKNWSGLNREIENIKGVVSIIEDIAERTNLLSLNASIEAARAGKNGAGFAIVSSEVNKLSVQTAESAQNITRLVKTLVSEMKNMDAESRKMGEVLEEKVSSALQAADSLEQMKNSINQSAAALSQFQGTYTSVLNEFNQLNEELLDLLEIQKIITNDTENNARMLFKSTYEINEIRKKNLEQIASPTLLLMIRTVKTEHMLWKWWLISYLFGLYHLPEEQVLDHTQCRLGKWYYSVQNPAIKDLSYFRDMEEPHAELHRLAKSIFQQIKNNDVIRARSEINELENVSFKIIGFLDSLEKEVIRKGL